MDQVDSTWARAQIEQLEAQVRGISRDRDARRARIEELEAQLRRARLAAQALANELSDVRVDPAGGYE